MHDFGDSVQGFENSDLHIFVFWQKGFRKRMKGAGGGGRREGRGNRTKGMNR